MRLEKLLPTASGFRLFAKLEALNPGGSIKDRPAVAIISDALERGVVVPGATVVESSSGNMGVGLAQACQYHGLRFICVVDKNASSQNLRIMEAYGAEIDLVAEPDPETGELLEARLKRVRAWCDEIDGAFWPNQYANLNNPASHYKTTMREIVEALDGKVDCLFVATSTCGTIRGCAEYAKELGLGTRIIAVDAKGSLIFSDQKATRRIPGLGAGIKPPLYERSSIDEYLLVDDLDCVVGCRKLLAREAILAGGSSGGVVTAIERYAPRLDGSMNCVAIFPDRGERYLDTIYSDEWVGEHFGEIHHLLAGKGRTLRPLSPPAAEDGGSEAVPARQAAPQQATHPAKEAGVSSLQGREVPRLPTPPPMSKENRR